MPKQSLKSEHFHPDDKDMAVKERAERLRAAVKRAGGNTQVAIRAHMNVGTLNNYIAGREMKASAMIALAKACGVSLDWLAEGAESSARGQVEAKIPPCDIVNIRYYDVNASAGYGTFGTENPNFEIVPISKSLLRRAFGISGSNCVMIHASGDSMTPTISSGDPLLVDMTQSENLVGIFVLILDGLLLVKRLSVRTGGKLLISSDNPLYPPEEVPLSSVHWGVGEEAHGTCILGRVISHTRLLS